ncbi:MAG TPA: AsnC family transcriptional regulator [Cyanothece sp. UBA12306]|nr:AsnC family transcriptional regulator [Cyanothece sp. UBA12306]
MTKFYENQESDSSGLKFSNLQKLPEDERTLINWLRRSGKKSLLEIAEKIAKDEQATLAILTPLVNQGFIKEVSEEGEVDLYQVKQPKTRKKAAMGLLAKKKKDKPQESSTDDSEATE